MSGDRQQGCNRHDISPLLSYLANGPATLRPGGDGVVLLRPIGRAQAPAGALFAAALLAEAAKAGLIRRKGDAVALSDDGRKVLSPDARQKATRVDVVCETRTIDGMVREVQVNLAESPLSSLRRLKQRDGSPFIDEDAFQAGERLRVDFERGQLQPRISANWEASVARNTRGAGYGASDLSDMAVAARDRTHCALKAVGPELSGVLVDVCCFLKGLETVERERQWPVRSGKLMLRTALASLVRHYRN